MEFICFHNVTIILVFRYVPDETIIHNFFQETDGGGTMVRSRVIILFRRLTFRQESTLNSFEQMKHTLLVKCLEPLAVK